jgi:hypothetical protein
VRYLKAIIMLPEKNAGNLISFHIQHISKKDIADHRRNTFSNNSNMDQKYFTGQEMWLLMYVAQLGSNCRQNTSFEAKEPVSGILLGESETLE